MPKKPLTFSVEEYCSLKKIHHHCILKKDITIIFMSNFLPFILVIRFIFFIRLMRFILVIRFFYFSYILYFLYVLYFLHLGCKCVQLFTAWGGAVHKVLSALTVLHSWHFVQFLHLHWLQTKWINRRGLSRRWIGWNECAPGAWVKCILWVAGGILGR